MVLLLCLFIVAIHQNKVREFLKKATGNDQKKNLADAHKAWMDSSERSALMAGKKSVQI